MSTIGIVALIGLYPKLLELETSNLVHVFVWGMTSERTKSGRGLGHLTLQLLAYDRTYPENYLMS